MVGLHIKKLLGGDREYKVIPIGVDCSATYYLRKTGLRREAFPFDWNVTPVNSVIELVNNDFQDFFSNENLVYLEPVKRLLFDENGVEMEMMNEFITPAICKKYKMLFPHDFPKNYEALWDSVSEKYQRRAYRLKSLFRSGSHIVFVHAAGCLNEWQQEKYVQVFGERLVNDHQGWEQRLAEVLKTKHPDLTFSLYPLQEFASEIQG